MKHHPPPIPKPKPRELSRPSVQFDWQDWVPYLADSDIPEDQRQEWVETLWGIVLGFVDLGFDVKSSAETCGEAIDLKAVLERAVLSSGHGSEEDAHE